MRSVRRVYYNGFSKFYDRFVALHSSSSQGTARAFLAGLVPLHEGQSVLDICTGTGSLLPHLRDRVGPEGLVAGVDFSRGMLSAAGKKTREFENIVLLEANAGCLPFEADTFDAVTCSHAFYELKGDTQERALREILRVLKPEGTFFMMEHDEPGNLLIRILFYIRLASMGTGRAISILRREKELLRGYFRSVEQIVTPRGRSKIMVCRK